MDRQYPLVITGMHRSGTSLVGRLLDAAGIHLGEELLGPAQGNPYGHFEDVAFIDLHRRSLARAGVPELPQADAATGFDDEERRQAEVLVEERASRQPWGFKDPRTALHLDEWRRLLPDARYLFVYRSPLEVADSLLRRASDGEILRDPSLGLRAWAVYNRPVADAVDALGDRALLVHAHAVAADPDGFLRQAAALLQVELDTVDSEALVDQTVLSRLSEPPGLAVVMQRVWPETWRLYERLQAAAAMPAPAAGTAGETADPQAAVDAVLALRPATPGRRGATGSAVPENLVLAILRHALATEVAEPRSFLLHRDLQQCKAERAGLAEQLERREREMSEHTANLEQRQRELEVHNGNLEHRQRELEQHGANLELRQQELSRHTANLEQEIAVRDERIRALEEHTGNLERLLAEAEPR